MKTLVISGSRNPEGRTASLINALCRGMSTAGSDSEVLYLPQMNIELCRQCNDDGWGICRDETKCIIDDDDFTSVVEKIDNADAVVFANPVYFGDLSESLRGFLDRLRRITRHHTGKKGITGKTAVGICVAGGGGGGAPNCAVSLEKTLTNCGFDIVDMVPARRQNLDMKLDVLRIVGKWVAENA